MESQSSRAHFAPMRFEWGQRGWEFKFPFVLCPLSGGRLCGKECLLPTFIFNPVVGHIPSHHACAGGFHSRRLEPLRL